MYYQFHQGNWTRSNFNIHLRKLQWPFHEQRNCGQNHFCLTRDKDACTANITSSSCSYPWNASLPISSIVIRERRWYRNGPHLSIVYDVLESKRNPCIFPCK